MTAGAAFIAGDWGTSHLRLTLCTAEGAALATLAGPGAVAARGRFAAIFDEAVAPWRSSHGALPAILSGMAGSGLGWQEVPYLLCPEELDEIAASTLAVRPDVHLVAGMSCTNPLGAFDVMRGEETQLLGARLLDPRVGAGRQLVCLPGTHTKWVSLLDGVVQEFLTVPTGELFGLLCEHSVLVREPATPIVHRPAEFELGLDEAARHPQIPLPHRLFQSRSLRLNGQLAAAGAASWVSGLLIGTDVGGSLPQFAGHAAALPVYLIGAPALVDCYSTALAKRGRTTLAIDGDAAARAGLAFVFQQLPAVG